MENTGNRKVRDPSADTCFLGGSIDESPDADVSIEAPFSATSAEQDNSALIPPSISSDEVMDSKGTLHSVPTLAADTATTAPGVASFRYLDTIHQGSARLPTGEEIDPKNTLQSFHVPANVSNDRDDLLVASTLPPAGGNVASNHPTLPSGEIIDSKNTLQTFNTGNRAPIPVTNPALSDPTIPISDALPTASAWIPPSQISEREVPAAETVYVAELIAPEAPRRRYATLFWMAFGILAIVGASVIAGVCFSGNCGSSDPVNPEVASAVSEYINEISYLKQKIVANDTSAESQALRWLIEKDDVYSGATLLSLNSQDDDDEVRRRVRQRYALATLWFQRSSSDTWKNKTRWLSRFECLWFGITCDETGSVTEILFFDYDTEVGNGYVGSIPPDIALLTSLRKFSMRSNDVTGTIPESIGNCSQMYLFDIRGGSVTGTLPSSLGFWTDLYYFDVSQNEITVNRDDISTFINEISFLDQEIMINGTSAESRALAWLIKVDSLFSVNGSSELTMLAVSSQIDDDNEARRRVSQRYALATLWFQEVDEVRNWTNTSGWLQVYNECEWYGIICKNGSVTEISFYSLETYLGNGFVGTIPPDIGLLSSLNIFFMGSNEITGTIPESIGNCTQLIAFVIPECSVTGTIPSSFGHLSYMFYFDLSINAITGTIPDSLVSWTNMNTFAVQENLLLGSIPSFITLWRGLERFWVYKNQLSRTIPKEIGNLADMTSFAVFTNRLTGSLPPSIGQMTALTEFLVTENMLTGTIPSSIGNWSLIENASFLFNNFTGSIPTEICAHINNTTDRLTRDCNVDCTCCTGCVE